MSNALGNKRHNLYIKIISCWYYFYMNIYTMKLTRLPRDIPQKRLFDPPAICRHFRDDSTSFNTGILICNQKERKH